MKEHDEGADPSGALANESSELPVGPFSSQLWRDVETLFGKILGHPLPLGLTDGTLEESSFVYFVIQNLLLTRDFARGLSILASKAGPLPRILVVSTALRSIQEVLTYHEEMVKKWQIDVELLENAQQVPNCLLASSYLLRLAFDRPFYESLAAFLPFLWINMAVARHLLPRKLPTRDDFGRFLEIYSDLSLAETLASLVALLDEVAVEVTEADRHTMRRNFALASKMVYMVYDVGHLEQRWPL